MRASRLNVFRGLRLGLAGFAWDVYCLDVCPLWGLRSLVCGHLNSRPHFATAGRVAIREDVPLSFIGHSLSPAQWPFRPQRRQEEFFSTISTFSRRCRISNSDLGRKLWTTLPMGTPWVRARSRLKNAVHSACTHSAMSSQVSASSMEALAERNARTMSCSILSTTSINSSSGAQDWHTHAVCSSRSSSSSESSDSAGSSSRMRSSSPSSIAEVKPANARKGGCLPWER